MVWSEENKHLIKKLEAVINKCNSERVIMHIFVPKNSTSVPRDQPWIKTHESLTQNADAAKVGLIVFILQEYAHGEKANGKNRAKRRSPLQKTIYLVQSEKDDPSELFSLLQSSGTPSHCDVKLLLLNSVDLALQPQGKARCRECHGLLRDEENEDMKKEQNFVDRKLGSPYENRLPQSEANPCLICGRHRNRDRPPQNFGQSDELKVRFSRHYSKSHKKGSESREERKEYPANENDGTKGSESGYSSCCSYDRDVDECRLCRGMLQKHDSEAKNHERSKSSKEYKAMANCQCSREGATICVNCLLVRLAKPYPELKLGRSESAPGIFYHGKFKEENRFTKSSVTLEEGTSTDGDLEMVNRVATMEKATEVRALTREKSTNTPLTKSTNTSHEKSTSTHDLEGKQEVLEESAVEITRPLLSDSKRSLLFSCVFCPEKAYRSKHLLDVHMKNNHKKCNCPCQQYFKTREDYLTHFYFVYPLPCMVDKKCPERFRSLYYQSLHHKETHFASKPFLCIPCCQLNDDAPKTKVAFKDIASLRIHANSYGHDSREMYLKSIDDKPDDCSLPFSMRCSGINYC